MFAVLKRVRMVLFRQVLVKLCFFLTELFTQLNTCFIEFGN